jgi:methionyl-tRNA formyltransferase
VSLNIIFAGTPSFALPSLQALYHSSHAVVAVYTQPDRPAGRGKKLKESSIKTFALEHGLPVFQPENFKLRATVESLQALKADVMIVAAYGLILPKDVLHAPFQGCINVHASLLPRWRGAAPIQYALLKGDTKTGITLMQMDEGLDTGDILSAHTVNIGKHENFKSLHDKLAHLGAKALLELLPRIEKHLLNPKPQNNSLATYAPKIQKTDAKINWEKAAIDIDRQVRAFNPYPGAYSTWDDQILRIYQAEIIPEHFTQSPGTLVLSHGEPIVVTGKYGLKLLNVQLSGKRNISGRDFVNAYFQKCGLSVKKFS